MQALLGPLFAAQVTVCDALAVDHAGGGGDLAPGLLAALAAERVMHPLQGAVPAPVAEIAVQRAARRQVLRDGAPRTAGAQPIHQAVHPLAHDDPALAAAPPGGWCQRLDQPPRGVGELARIAQPVAVAARAVLARSHRHLAHRCWPANHRPLRPHNRPPVTDPNHSRSPRTDTHVRRLVHCFLGCAQNERLHARDCLDVLPPQAAQSSPMSMNPSRLGMI